MGIVKLPAYKYLFAIVDFVVILGTFYFSAYFVYLVDTVGYQSIFRGADYTHLVFVPLTLIFLFIFQSNNLYKIHIALSKSTHTVAIIKSLFYSVLFTILISFIVKFNFILDSRRFMFIFSITSVVSLILVRIVVIRTIMLKLNKFSLVRRKALIIGSGQRGKILAAKLQMEDDLGINVIGFVDDEDDLNAKITSDKSVLGRVSDLPQLVKKYKIDEVIISISGSNYERLLQILDQCKLLKINVKLNSNLFNIVSQKIDTEKYSDIPLVDASPRVNTYLYRFIKRIIDLGGALIGIILLSPLFILISLLIKLTSKGPILHSQSRIGINGKEFKFHKFRSMTVHNEGEKDREEKMIEFIKNGSTNNNGNTKIINESRVTAIGKIIRKTSLDELPQLLNVIKGDMSLVGPRPCLPYEFENFYDWQKRKVDILPGCTGVWQVSGRSSVSFNDSIILDLYYINNMSPWLDLQIILKTVPVMLFARGGK